MRHQLWDPFRNNGNEAGGGAVAEEEATDWQGELLVLAAFIQGFSEQIAEAFPEEQIPEHVPCSQGKL